MANTLTRSKSATKAQILTAVTVAAAGVAAYAVANLSQQPATTTPQAIAQDDARRACINTCAQNNGTPCSTYSANPISLQKCFNQVQACVDQCPAPGPSLSLLSTDGSVQVLPNASKGIPYRRHLVVGMSEQESGYWTVTSRALPPGLVLDPKSGYLSGVPSSEGNFRFGLDYVMDTGVATEASRTHVDVDLAVVLTTAKTDPAAGSAITGIAPAPVRITTPVSGLIIALGQPYELRMAATGLTSADLPVWNLSYGSLPHGLTLSPDGVISGKPDQEQYANFGIAIRTSSSGPNEVTFVDGGIKVVAVTSPLPSTPAAQAFSIAPVAPELTAEVGSPISFPFSVSGDSSERVWSISSIPQGMKFDVVTHTLYGTPLAAGTSDFTVSAVKGTDVVTRKYVWTVTKASSTASTTVAPAGAVSISPVSSDLSGQVGVFASFPFSVNNDSSERVWTVSNLPDGMKFDPLTHVLSGTPTKAGTSVFIVSASKGTDIATRQYNWTVSAAVPAIEVGVNLPDGEAGKDYVTQMLARGGSGSYRWTLDKTVGNATWTLSPTGELKSIAPKEGVYTLTLHVDDASAVMSQSAQVTVNIKQVTAVTTGTKTTDATNKDATGTVEPIMIDKTIPDGVAEKDYSVTLKATGGSGTYSWSFGDGLTPLAGWTLSSGGILATKSPKEGVYAFSVRALDTTSNSYQQSQITVKILSAGSVTTGTTTTDTTKNTTTSGTVAPVAFQDVGTYPDGFVTYYYNSRPFEVTGGTAPYKYSISSGALPEGLTMTDNGAISGTPTTAKSYSFVMTITDAKNDVVRANRVILIRAAAEHTITNTIVQAPVTSSDSATQARLNALTQMGVRVHDLVKLQDDGNPNTQTDSTVYYIGADGRRHAFPNSQVYFTWFPNFTAVRTIGSADLATIPLGANITYRPGIRLVKFLSDPRVYLVDRSRVLRWIKTGADAQAIYGSNWALNVDDISDAFFVDYRVTGSVDDPASVRPSQLSASSVWPSDVLPQQ
ncbi:putative Ig domain-containing protein [Patescibacteria group bacterium]|nr:putative Ig domain-containing protein [Patescibacteria group bacterium]